MQSQTMKPAANGETTAVVTASMISAIGATFFLILPLFLGVLAEEYSLSDKELGLLGSAYLAGFTLLSTSAVIWINRLNWRRVTLIGLLCLMVFCGLVVAGRGFVYLVFVIGALGGAAGTVFAVATRVLSDVRNPDRAFGIKLFAEQVCGATLIFVIPLYLLPRWGLTGLIAGVLLAFAILGVSAFKLPESAAQRPASANDESEKSNAAVWWALLGLAVFMLGLSAVWAFVDRIANDAGLSAAAIGAMLSVGLVFGALGAGLAALVGDSFGHTIPQVTGTALLLVCVYLLAGDLTVFRFGLAVSLLSGMWNFMLAYQMASVARLDPGRRRTVLIAPAIALGATFGPGIAGLIKVGPGYGPIFVLAITCLFVTIVVFLALDRRVGRAARL